MGEEPAFLVRIRREILLHVLVDLFLQIDAHGPIQPNDLIGAYSRIGRNVSARVWNSDVGGNVAHGVMRALDGSGDEAALEFLAGLRRVVNLWNGAGQKYSPQGWPQPRSFCLPQPHLRPIGTG